MKTWFSFCKNIINAERFGESGLGEKVDEKIRRKTPEEFLFFLLFAPQKNHHK